MKNITRREAIKTLTFGSLGTGWLLTGCKNEQPQHAAVPFKDISASDLKKWEKQFFTDHEYETVRQLGNMIIPADEHSGNAEAAGVPHFIDFMMYDQPWRQTPMRGGLAWLDAQCDKFYGKPFTDCSKSQQKEMLDRIAYPDKATPEMEQGVHFFNSMRDLTASGFWSSKIGIEDLQYLGNKATKWNGCPEAACKQLGVSYDKT